MPASATHFHLFNPDPVIKPAQRKRLFPLRTAELTELCLSLSGFMNESPPVTARRYLRHARGRAPPFYIGRASERERRRGAPLKPTISRYIDSESTALSAARRQILLPPGVRRAPSPPLHLFHFPFFSHSPRRPFPAHRSFHRTIATLISLLMNLLAAA